MSATILWVLVSTIGGLVVVGKIVGYLAFRSIKRWIFIEAMMADEQFWNQKDFCRKAAFNLHLDVEYAKLALKVTRESNANNCVTAAKVLMAFYFTGVDVPDFLDTEPEFKQSMLRDSFNRWMLKLGIEEATVRASMLTDVNTRANLKRPPLDEPPAEYNWIEARAE